MYVFRYGVRERERIHIDMILIWESHCIFVFFFVGQFGFLRQFLLLCWRTYEGLLIRCYWNIFICLFARSLRSLLSSLALSDVSSTMKPLHSTHCGNVRKQK